MTPSADAGAGESDGLIVRRWLEADAGDTAALLSDSRVSQWYSIDSPRTWTWAGVNAEWANPTRPGVCVTGVRSAGRTFVGVARIDNGMLEYAVVPDLWGNGYGRSLVAASLDLAVRDLDLDAVWANVLRGNLASRRILERLGFVLIGPAPRGSRSSRADPSALRYCWRAPADAGQ